MSAPALGSHIELYVGANQNVTAYNKATSKTYMIGAKEAQALSLMDGSRTIEEIQRECTYYTVDEVEKLAAAFAEIGFFTEGKKKFNLWKLKFRILNPNNVLKAESRFTHFLFRMIFIGCPILLAMGAGLYLARLANSSTPNLLSGMELLPLTQFRLWDYVLLLILFAVCLSLHEIGHVISARYYDVNVPEVGVMLYFFLPCAYTNVSAIHLLKGKKKKILVLASGTFVNFGLIGVFLLLMSLIDSPHAVAILLCLIVVNLGTVFMNGMVFLKFDGYYILEVLLNEPKLRDHALTHAKQYLGSILAKDRNAVKTFHNRIAGDANGYLTHIGYCAYAIFSVLYVPVLLMNTLVSVFQFYI